MKLTEREIQKLLFYWLEQKSYEMIIPNFTPPNWWECDLYSITKGGRVWEMEIKLTAKDLKADAQKVRMPKRMRGALGDGENKHAMLAAKSPKGPNRFSFVTPEGLIPLDQLPKWAGLIEVRESHHGRLYVGEVVRAPYLHKELPAKGSHKGMSRNKFYFRFWALRNSAKHLQADHELEHPLELVRAVLQRREEELRGLPGDEARLLEIELLKEILTHKLKDYFEHPDRKNKFDNSDYYGDPDAGEGTEGDVEDNDQGGTSKAPEGAPEEGGKTIL